MTTKSHSSMRKALKAIQHPQWALLRAAAYLERAAISRVKDGFNPEIERERSIGFLSKQFGCAAHEYLDEYRRSDLKGRFAAAFHRLTTKESSSEFDCESMYLTIRAARPAIVVETGVLYGAMTWHILEALEQNGGGVLHSIDLPRAPSDTRPALGILVPEHLRGAWHLHLGNSLEVLPQLLQELEEIQVFHHDSLHTVEHMLIEFTLAHDFLAPGGTLTSHDVIHSPHYPNAFPLFATSFGYSHITCRNFGIASKPAKAKQTRRRSP